MIAVDLFAGGGGASTGIEAALGQDVAVALNHWPVALAVHTANHPGTRHLEADVWQVRPLAATDGERVGLLWASPDCTHFSVAKGDVPRDNKLRSLAWVVCRWARDVQPGVIFVENVPEFVKWGPLDKATGKPNKAKAGQTFKRWCTMLRRAGYEVEHRVLDASLYGAPTKRKRLFVIARCDGNPIHWPTPTHGPGKLPVHTAAECIDWTIPCPSIFERKKPLADKTLWRVAQGIRRFVLESSKPFIVKFRGDAHSSDLDEPMPTITGGGNGPGRPGGAAHGYGVVAPTLLQVNHAGTTGRGDHVWTVDEPLRTMAGKNGFAVVAPTLVQTGYGERPGQRPRYLDIEQPIGTLVDGQKHALVSAFLAKHFGGVVGHPVEQPLGTVTGVDHHSLVSATLVQPGQRRDGGTDDPQKPLSTIVAKGRHAIAAATLVQFRGDEKSRHLGARDIQLPLPTITGGGLHIGEVRAFLTAFYGSEEGAGQQLTDPMRTITAKHRLGLVTLHGVEYQIVDIGLRMLEPHELLRAQFGRFAADYDLQAAKTKSDKVRLIGNSVCPELVEALVGANFQQEQEAVA